eukprot:XP_855488.3 upstream stimulatory factor 2 [Canis lupus familiaris]
MRPGLCLGAPPTGRGERACALLSPSTPFTSPRVRPTLLCPDPAARLGPGGRSPSSGSPGVPSGPAFPSGGPAARAGRPRRRRRRPRAPPRPGPARARPPSETQRARSPGAALPPRASAPGFAPPPPPPPPPPPRARSSSRAADARAGEPGDRRQPSGAGKVTYRVVQVTDGQLDGQGDTAGAVSVVSTAAFAGGQQAVTQVGVDGAAQRPGPTAASVPPGPAAPFPLAVIQNPFSNGGSPAAEAVSGEARFAYFPASSVGDTTAVSVQTTDQSLQAGGQFYVMMTPQDVLQTGTQRTIAPRTHPYSPKIDGTRTPRDERRRAQHNEVERRRRDKINNWIVQLSKIIPDCNADNSKTGASKGGILSKACDYIRELRQTNQRMQETFKEAERLQMDNELLRQQIEELKNENAVLRAQLQQHNLEMVGESARQ